MRVDRLISIDTGTIHFLVLSNYYFLHNRIILIKAFYSIGSSSLMGSYAFYLLLLAGYCRAKLIRRSVDRTGSRRRGRPIAYWRRDAPFPTDVSGCSRTVTQSLCRRPFSGCVFSMIYVETVEIYTVRNFNLYLHRRDRNPFTPPHNRLTRSFF